MKRGSLTLSVRADDIPPSGRRFRVEADEAERRTLADDLGIVAVAELSVEFEVRPLGGGAFSVKGGLVGTVVQTDVVTLEPVRQAVEEAIDLTLVAAEDVAPAPPGPADLDAGEGPETFRNGRIELGMLAAEHLALGLDPYPRAEGVEFKGHVEDDSASASPFFALAKLTKDKE